MENSAISDGTKRPSTSTTSNDSNVRSKVRFWVSDIVAEMRRKSPAAVQKWVDSIPIHGASTSQSATATDDLPSASSNLTTTTDYHHEPDTLENTTTRTATTTANQIEIDKNKCIENRNVVDASPLSSSSLLYDQQLSKSKSSFPWNKSPILNRFSFHHTTTPSTNESKVISSTRTLGVDGTKCSSAYVGDDNDNDDDGGRNVGEGNCSSDGREVNKESVINKESELLCDNCDDNSSSSLTSNLKNLGKAKISEFYDKLNLNKKRYNFMKSRRMEAKQIIEKINTDLGRTMSIDDDVRNLTEDVCEHHSSANKSIPLEMTKLDNDPLKISLNDIDDVNVDDFDIDVHGIGGDVDDEDDDEEDEFRFDDTFPRDELEDISEEASTSYLLHSESSDYGNFLDGKRLGIGEIGRSASENPKPFFIKKTRLNEIGRSFSESKHDDDNDNNFMINERNNSCPNPIGNTSSYTSISNFSVTSTCGELNNLSHINGSQLVKDIATSLPRNNRVDMMIMMSNRRESSFSERQRNPLLRDSSIQSDSSHCSSVESLLESRKPDPESILINLGFGPVATEDVLSKIPKRFLKPSKVKGVDTDEFVRQQKLASHVHENSVLGYRGLVGNPHIPPSSIVAKIHERFQLNETNRFINETNLNRPSSAPPTPGANLL